MKYFARISSEIRPANRLQEYLLRLVRRFDNVLLDDPEDLFKQVEQFAQQASRANHRCTPQKAGAIRDFQTKQITGIGAGGLFTISLHKVAGTIATAPETAPQPERPAVPAKPVAPPAPEPEPESQPRQAICKSREDDTPARFMFVHQFSSTIQAQLQKGHIWRMYENVLGQVTAEEFGGKTYPILL